MNQMKLGRFRNLILVAGIFGANFIDAPKIFAAEFYRRSSHGSFLGANQGNVGSCQSEAEKAAIESVFRMKGSTLEISSFWRHHYLWHDNKEDRQNISLGSGDKGLLNQFGPFVPAFAYPETGEGFDPYRTGERPSLTAIAVAPSSLPNATNHGLNREWYTFRKGDGSGVLYSNFRDLSVLRSVIPSERAVVLSLDSTITSDFQWNHSTGLLEEDYSWQKFLDAKKGEKIIALHAYAVVGFDDALYDGKGAIIVRNSWNTPRVVSAAVSPSIDQTNPEEFERYENELAKMKYKIHPALNLPGYYALPYAVIEDHIKHSVEGSGFSIFDMNFDHFGAAARAAENGYEVMYTPYTCIDKDASTNFIALRLLRTLNYFDQAYDDSKRKTNRKQSLRFAERVLFAESTERFSDPYRKSILSYARLTRARPGSASGVDRLKEFYSGAYDTYYCNSPETGETVWPTAEVYQTAAVQAALQAMASDPHGANAWLRYMRALEKVGALEQAGLGE
jgi:hypothetical protein